MFNKFMDLILLFFYFVLNKDLKWFLVFYLKEKNSFENYGIGLF